MFMGRTWAKERVWDLRGFVWRWRIGRIKERRMGVVRDVGGGR